MMIIAFLKGIVEHRNRFATHYGIMTLDRAYDYGRMAAFTILRPTTFR